MISAMTSNVSTKRVKIDEVEKKMQEIGEKVKLLEELLEETRDEILEDDEIVLVGHLPNIDRVDLVFNIPKWRIETDNVILTSPVTIGNIVLSDEGVRILADEKIDVKKIFVMAISDLWDGSITRALNTILDVVRNYVDMLQKGKELVEK